MYFRAILNNLTISFTFNNILISIIYYCSNAMPECIYVWIIVFSVFIYLINWSPVVLTSGEGQSEEEKAKKESGKPQVDEIVPVYRRDCHEEVYAGSHQYPGRGIYLLKFDNSYSLWRSKTVYYRVYYTR